MGSGLNPFVCASGSRYEKFTELNVLDRTINDRTFLWFVFTSYLRCWVRADDAYQWTRYTLDTFYFNWRRYTRLRRLKYDKCNEFGPYRPNAFVTPDRTESALRARKCRESHDFTDYGNMARIGVQKRYAPKVRRVTDASPRKAAPSDRFNRTSLSARTICLIFEKVSNTCTATYRCFDTADILERSQSSFVTLLRYSYCYRI